jgi:hypothetical protein
MLPTDTALLQLHLVLGDMYGCQWPFSQHSLHQDSTAEYVEQQHQQATQTRSCHRSPPDLVADVNFQKLVALRLQQYVKSLIDAYGVDTSLQSHPLVMPSIQQHRCAVRAAQLCAV